MEEIVVFLSYGTCTQTPIATFGLVMSCHVTQTAAPFTSR